MNSLATSIVKTFLITTCGDSDISTSIIKENIDINMNSLKIERSITTSSLFDNVRIELSQYRSLEEDWDGYGGVKPSNKVIEEVDFFISKLEKLFIKAPDAMVSGAGDISLYWEIDNSYLELNFKEEGRYSYLIEDGKAILGKDDNLIFASLPQEIEDFIYKYLKQDINDSISKFNNLTIINTPNELETKSLIA